MSVNIMRVSGKAIVNNIAVISKYMSEKKV